MILMSCASTEQKIDEKAYPENSGHVVLETFVGEQTPVMHADLLTWDFMADSSIEITGTVLDANDTPLSAVKICLLNDAGEMIAGEMDSDDVGNFKIAAKVVSASDHILFKHDDHETLDLVIKELNNSSEGMLVKYERVVLP